MCQYLWWGAVKVLTVQNLYFKLEQLVIHFLRKREIWYRSAQLATQNVRGWEEGLYMRETHLREEWVPALICQKCSSVVSNILWESGWIMNQICSSAVSKILRKDKVYIICNTPKTRLCHNLWEEDNWERIMVTYTAEEKNEHRVLSSYFPF